MLRQPVAVRSDDPTFRAEQAAPGYDEDTCGWEDLTQLRLELGAAHTERGHRRPLGGRGRIHFAPLAPESLGVLP
jgi:hypothetical protein